jgi:antitoxin ParD1/3/4
MGGSHANGKMHAARDKSLIIYNGVGMNESKSHHDKWPSAEEKAKNIAQAKALRTQAEKGGLRFSVYLPPELASWLLGLVEKGVFLDPSEAAFVILGEHQALEPHADLRRELLHRMLAVARNDPGPAIPAEDVFRKLREKRAPSEPAVWVK